MLDAGVKIPMPAVPQHVPVKLTQAQRRAVAEIAPELARRLKLGERNQRTIQFTLAELRAIREKAGAAVRHASTGTSTLAGAGGSCFGRHNRGTSWIKRASCGR